MDYLLVALSLAFNANMDTLAHAKQESIWQRWDNSFTQFILRGSNARESIPQWIKSSRLLYAFVKLFWDGWHVSKLLSYGSLFLAIASTWWQFLVFYLIGGSCHFLFYERFLRDNE